VDSVDRVDLGDQRHAPRVAFVVSANGRKTGTVAHVIADDVGNNAGDVYWRTQSYVSAVGAP
jgi:hypothetical protein